MHSVAKPPAAQPAAGAPDTPPQASQPFGHAAFSPVSMPLNAHAYSPVSMPLNAQLPNKNAFAGAHLNVPASPLEAWTSMDPRDYQWGAPPYPNCFTGMVPHPLYTVPYSVAGAPGCSAAPATRTLNAGMMPGWAPGGLHHLPQPALMQYGPSPASCAGQPAPEDTGGGPTGLDAKEDYVDDILGKLPADELRELLEEVDPSLRQGLEAADLAPPSTRSGGAGGGGGGAPAGPRVRTRAGARAEARAGWGGIAAADDALEDQQLVDATGSAATCAAEATLLSQVKEEDSEQPVAAASPVPPVPGTAAGGSLGAVLGKPGAALTALRTGSAQMEGLTGCETPAEREGGTACGSSPSCTQSDALGKDAGMQDAGALAPELAGQQVAAEFSNASQAGTTPATSMPPPPPLLGGKEGDVLDAEPCDSLRATASFGDLGLVSLAGLTAGTQEGGEDLARLSTSKLRRVHSSVGGPAGDKPGRQGPALKRIKSEMTLKRTPRGAWADVPRNPLLALAQDDALNAINDFLCDIRVADEDQRVAAIQAITALLPLDPDSGGGAGQLGKPFYSCGSLPAAECGGALGSALRSKRAAAVAAAAAIAGTSGAGGVSGTRPPKSPSSPPAPAVPKRKRSGCRGVKAV